MRTIILNTFYWTWSIWRWRGERWEWYVLSGRELVLYCGPGWWELRRVGTGRYWCVVMSGRYRGTDWVLSTLIMIITNTQDHHLSHTIPGLQISLHFIRILLATSYPLSFWLMTKITFLPPTTTTQCVSSVIWMSGYLYSRNSHHFIRRVFLTH